MNLFELIPSEENIYNTYIEDSIDRSREVVKFAEILDAIPSNCSIAIDSYWGSGKTFFVKQVKMLLDIYNDFIDDNYSIDKNKFKHSTDVFFNKGYKFDIQPQIAIYYDAWENDDEDPVNSLLYEICKTPIADPDFLKSKNLIDIAKSIISLFEKKDYTKLLESLKSDDVLSEIKVSKNLKELINDFFESLLPEHGERLVIFIDELDRCKPSFAVDLLEKIKHYFYNDKITFVFSVNSIELQHTIKQFYGENFDGYKYLSKMFDMYVTLPQPNLEKYYSYINITGNSTIDFLIRTVIEKYHFELREIKKYILMFQITTKKININSLFYSMNNGFKFSTVFILPIMMGLKIHNINLYNEFISGNNSEPLVSILGQAYREGIKFEKLLSPNETYYDSTDFGNMIVKVNIEEKIVEIYRYLFNYSYNNSGTNYYVGDIEFNKDNVKQLKKLVSMLSDYFEFPNELKN